MPSFPYHCPECGPMDRVCSHRDRDSQVCPKCGSPLKRDAAAQYRAQHVQIRQGTRSNVPEDIKWRSPSDPVRQEYSRTTSEEPDIWGTGDRYYPGQPDVVDANQLETLTV